MLTFYEKCCGEVIALHMILMLKCAMNPLSKGSNKTNNKEKHEYVYTQIHRAA